MASHYWMIIAFTTIMELIQKEQDIDIHLTYLKHLKTEKMANKYGGGRNHYGIMFKTSYQGIKTIHVADFLLSNEY